PRSPLGAPAALTVDHAGNLYVAEQSSNDCCPAATLGNDRVRKRDTQGNWTVLVPSSQVGHPTALAVDTAGNLYIAEAPYLNDQRGRLQGVNRVQKRDAQNNGAEIAAEGGAVGQVRS